MSISKRLMIYFITSTVIGGFISGCSRFNRMETKPVIVDPKATKVDLNDLPTEPLVLDDDKSPSNLTTIDDSNQTKDQVITYVDAKRGFALDFPKSWEGYYVVNELNEETIQIAFSGKSEYGKGFNEEANEYTGLQMFILFKDNGEYDFLDSVRDIGTIDGVNYCYATNTDYIVAGLVDGSDAESMEDREADFKKVSEMEQDVDHILKTFRAYP